MTRYRPHAPPPREGLQASCVVLPPGPAVAALDFFSSRFSFIPRADWQVRLAAGDVVDMAGAQVHADTLLHGGQRIYYFRRVEQEPALPVQERILWQDEHLVVVDKPHFLPVIPSGKYVRETLLVRLGRSLGCSTLAPVHRIDRDTAGLVLFTRNPASRNAYHQLFREHRVRKTYHAVARWNPELAWPLRRHTRIAEGSHFMQQAEVEGAPNALTTIRPLRHAGGLALYELQPVSGQRHQLRVHMNALGLPILNDGIYPTLTPEAEPDFGKPLQLLAHSLAFDDPLSSQARYFESGLQLQDLESLQPETGFN